MESISILAGGETILSRLISRDALLDSVVSLLVATGIRDGGVEGRGEGGWGKAVGDGEERAEFKNRCFISLTASPGVIFDFGDELEGLEKIFGLDFAGSRLVERSGVLKSS